LVRLGIWDRSGVMKHPKRARNRLSPALPQAALMRSRSRSPGSRRGTLSWRVGRVCSQSHGRRCVPVTSPCARSRPTCNGCDGISSFTAESTHALLARLQGAPWLVASLLYGSGLRLMEALRLRIKDIALERGELVVREAKGCKDRVTMLPVSLDIPLRAHLGRLRSWYEEERRRERPGVTLPAALARKYPRAGTQWAWQYLFPSAILCRDPHTDLQVLPHL